jgi:hypothetical protein
MLVLVLVGHRLLKTQYNRLKHDFSGLLDRSATLGSSFTTASRRSLRRASTVTMAPLSLSPSATARPMPADPPAGVL